MNRGALLVGVGTAVVLTCGTWTWRRNEVWHDEMSIWSDAVAKSPRKGRPLYNQGTVYHNQLHDMPGATARYLATLPLEVGPDGHFPPTTGVKISSLGNTLRAQGNPENSEACLLFALQLDPTESLHWYNLGRLYMFQKRFDYAIGFFNKAIEIDPFALEARTAQGLCYEELKDWVAARDAFVDLLTCDPGELRGHYHLGFCWARLGRPRDASLEFGWAIATHETFPRGYIGAGEVFATLGQYDRAVLAFKQAVRLSEEGKEFQPELANALAGLAFSLHGLAVQHHDPHLTEHAVSVYERLLEAEPESVEARVDLAVIEAGELGDRKRAAEVLAPCDAMDLTPGEREAVIRARAKILETPR